MTEVHKITVTIKPPRANSKYPYGLIAFGCYVVEDGVVTLTDPNGKPAGDETGKKFRHKLVGNEDARAWACKMTKELRLALRDKAPSVNNFDGPIAYPKMKLA